MNSFLEQQQREAPGEAAAPAEKENRAANAPLPASPASAAGKSPAGGGSGDAGGCGKAGVGGAAHAPLPGDQLIPAVRSGDVPAAIGSEMGRLLELLGASPEDALAAVVEARGGAAAAAAAGAAQDVQPAVGAQARGGAPPLLLPPPRPPRTHAHDEGAFAAGPADQNSPPCSRPQQMLTGTACFVDAVPADVVAACLAPPPPPQAGEEGRGQMGIAGHPLSSPGLTGLPPPKHRRSDDRRRVSATPAASDERPFIHSFPAALAPFTAPSACSCTCYPCSPEACVCSSDRRSPSPHPIPCQLAIQPALAPHPPPHAHSRTGQQHGRGCKRGAGQPGAGRGRVVG